MSIFRQSGRGTGDQIFDSRLETIQLRVAAAEHALHRNKEEIDEIDTELDRLMTRKTRLSAEIEAAPGIIERYTAEMQRIREMCNQAHRFRRAAGSGHATSPATKLDHMALRLEKLFVELRESGVSQADLDALVVKSGLASSVIAAGGGEKCAAD